MVKQYDYINTSKDYYSLNGKHLYIWGRCPNALQLYILASESGAIVEGFIDSFIEDGDEEYAGRKLYSPDKLAEKEGLVIYIAPIRRANRLGILNRLESFNNPIVLMQGQVYGPGLYDTKKMAKEIEHDGDMIKYVESHLYDQYSMDTFSNLVKYRKTNDANLLNDIFEQSHPQYFAPGIMKCTENEVFVDAGGFNGSTSRDFAKYVKDKYEKIYILEPDDTMFYVAKENVKAWGLKNVELVKKGAYSENTVLRFHKSPMLSSSKIDEGGEEIIETTSIDLMLNGRRATFIKMDIEGAEVEALIGTRNTIQQYKPKLAISIYHKDDDLWKIPYMLMKEYPDYKFYIRHYTDMTIETVLYCV